MTAPEITTSEYVEMLASARDDLLESTGEIKRLLTEIGGYVHDLLPGVDDAWVTMRDKFREQLFDMLIDVDELTRSVETCGRIRMGEQARAEKKANP